MGWAHFITFRIYSKKDFKKVFEITEDELRSGQHKLNVDVPKEFQDGDKYYVNIVFGTCNDPAQPLLIIDGYPKPFTCSWNYEEEYTKKELSDYNTMVFHEYNKTRLNLPMQENFKMDLNKAWK